MLRAFFFLVFSQLTVGGLGVNAPGSGGGDGAGFFRTCASIYLLIWVCVLAGLEWARPGSSWGLRCLPFSF